MWAKTSFVSKGTRTIVGEKSGPSPEGTGGVSKGEHIVVETTANEVRGFVPKWLPGQDSNLRQVG